MAQVANFLLDITARTRSNRVRLVTLRSWSLGSVADGRNSAIAALTRPANNALGMGKLEGVCQNYRV
jgi:hypothetical protein